VADMLADALQEAVVLSEKVIERTKIGHSRNHVITVATRL